MKNNDKRIWLSHYELLKLIEVISAVKHSAIRHNNKAEFKLSNELLGKLLNFDVDSKGTVIVLDSLSRYSLWNIMEHYIEFCAEANKHIEYALAVTISTKLSG